ncbi:MAG: DegV family protein [Ilumatobacteraceae bacterium]
MTDSNSMIPWNLVDELGIIVVPLTITIAGIELTEDRDLDVEGTYIQLRTGATVSTSAPSPGSFAVAYAQLAGSPVVSVHIGSNFSATSNAARLGAAAGGFDVHVVDSGVASFMAGCCVLAAARSAGDGNVVDAVIEAAERTAAGVETIFTLAELDRARAGGRFDGRPLGTNGVPVIRMVGGAFEQIGTAISDVDAASAMFDAVVQSSQRLRIGVGGADAGPVVDDLFERLREARPDDEIIRYTVGPTVAAHAGMGTFGIVYHPLDRI